MENSVTRGLSCRFTMVREGFRLSLQLDADPGQTIALLGPNGAGKTTALEALAGLEPLRSGYIHLGDRVLDDVENGLHMAPADRGVGMMTQADTLFPHLSALDNVAFGLRVRGSRRRDARQQAARWLDAVGLAGRHDRHPAHLSGGQRQRVALARALITNPDMLLLDEPFSALDVSSRGEMRLLLQDHLAGFPGPTLLVTHDPAEAFFLADRLVILDGGEEVQSGDADQIRLRPANSYAADLAGVNLVAGDASGRTLTVEEHALVLADEATGPVIALIHPRAVSIHLERPTGSPRNSWQTTIRRIERHADRVRVQTGAPLPITAEITTDATSILNLLPGSSVWLSVKATEIQLIS